MARDISDYTNYNTPDSDYPRGRVRDKSTGISGTKVKENMMGDITQFFSKLMAEAGVTPNHLPDNEYSGWQLFDAFKSLIETGVWATYTPTLSARNVSDAPVVGGFAGTIYARWVKTSSNIVHIIMIGGSVATTSTASQLIFSFPIALSPGQSVLGYALCKYYDGSSNFAVEVSANYNAAGQGTEFKINKLDGSAFGVTSNGTFGFSITFELKG